MHDIMQSNMICIKILILYIGCSRNYFFWIPLQASVPGPFKGPLGPFKGLGPGPLKGLGPGPNGFPWVLMGRSLMGPFGKKQKVYFTSSLGMQHKLCVIYVCIAQCSRAVLIFRPCALTF